MSKTYTTSTPAPHSFALTIDLTVLAASDASTDKRIQLLPSGAFKAQDGRPVSADVGYDNWLMDDIAYASVLAAQANHKNDYLIDFDHAAVFSSKAVAAGWFTGFDFDPATGLWATGVRFTPAARAAIQAEEYKYISAVFRADAQGRVRSIYNAALTNTPALDGMAAVALAQQNSFNNTNNTSELPMKTLLFALGLAADAHENTALTALSALQAKAQKLEADLTAAQASAFDAAKHIALSEYQSLNTQFVALSNQVSADKKAALIAQLEAEGKLLPTQKTYALSLDIAGLTAFAQTLSPLTALTQDQTTGTTGAGAVAQLSAEELAVCSAAGITADVYIATKTKLASAAA